MAGHGKVPDEHRSRERDEQPWETVPGEGYQGTFTPLADEYRTYVDGQAATVPFLASTREWFVRAARSPAAAKWTATDFDLLRLIVTPLFDAVARGAQGRMSELRLQLGELGLTPLARTRMRIKVEPAGRPNAQNARVSSRERFAARGVLAVDRAEVLKALSDDDGAVTRDYRKGRS